MDEAKRYVMIDADGLVYDVVMWDGETPWVHDAAQVIQNDTVNIGDKYEEGEFKSPPPEVAVGPPRKDP